jgi:hypothetical protein
MRRPDQLTGMRISLERRVIEPESFVSSSCVGDQFQNLYRMAMRACPSPLAQGHFKAGNNAARSWASVTPAKDF